MDLFSQRWFGYEVIDPFVPFSITHLGTIAVVILGIIIMYFFRHHLAGEKAKNIMRYSLVGALVFGELYWYIWKGLQTELTLAADLPFELCSLSGFLSIYVLLTRQKGWFDILYYIGIAGAFAAIVTPEMSHNFPHFRFIGYMIFHAAIVYTCFFLLWVEGWKPSSKSILRTLLALNVLVGCMMLINRWTGGNYMFLTHKPTNPTPIDYLGPHPWYILSLEGVVMVICVLMYLPFRQKRWRIDQVQETNKQDFFNS